MSLDTLRALPLRLLPQQLSSRLAYALARVQIPWIKHTLIRTFIHYYRVAMHEAQEPNPHAYQDFNQFFCRALREDARPLPTQANALACPVDGTISQLGYCDGDTLIQAKGQHYTLSALLGGEATAAFHGGAYATLYLSPRDYHRVHCPLDAQVQSMRHIPGRLFSVSPLTTRTVPGLFTRNERLVVNLQTAIGPVAVILVGAVNVGCLETVWSGPLPRTHAPRHWHYPEPTLSLPRGAELGRFNLGSTVILVLPPGHVRWAEGLRTGDPVTMGQVLATLTSQASPSTHPTGEEHAPG